MGTRGRKSAADLALVTPDGSVSRPRPPAELTSEQADEWRSVVNSLPAEQFPRAVHGLLAGYCRHAVALRHVGQLIDAHEQEEQVDIQTYDRLLKMQERETRCLASIAIRLGIASVTRPDISKTPGSLKKPWE